MDEEERGQPTGKRLTERVDDAAVEEDAVRERVGEQQPDTARRTFGGVRFRPVAVDCEFASLHRAGPAIVENRLVVSLFQLVLGTVAVGVTAFLLAATLRLRASSTSCSPRTCSGSPRSSSSRSCSPRVTGLSQANLLWALLGVLVAATGLWYALGRPPGPSFRPRPGAARRSATYPWPSWPWPWQGRSATSRRSSSARRRTTTTRSDATPPPRCSGSSSTPSRTSPVRTTHG